MTSTTFYLLAYIYYKRKYYVHLYSYNEMYDLGLSFPRHKSNKTRKGNRVNVVNEIV